MFRRFVVAYVAVATLLLGGCEVDSYLDPSVVGRWEHTPVVLPILDRLDVIDEPEDQVPGLTEVRSQDLVPEIREYVMAAGDVISVNVFELRTAGVEEQNVRQIDELGYIRLPFVGQVQAAGLTAKQLEQRLIDILDPEILRDPTVSVIVQEGQQKTFSVYGVAGQGTYRISKNNFRLLDALALAGSVPQDVERLYVIRQVPLADIVESGYYPDMDRPEHQPPMRRSDAPQEGDAETPADDDTDTADLIEGLSRGIDEEDAEADADAETDGDAPASRPAAEGEPERRRTPLDEAVEGGESGDGRFINVNGEWVWVDSAAEAQMESQGDYDAEDIDTLPPPEELITQRVIEVDARALLRGEARYNIVVRPGDKIRIPPSETGMAYVGGDIARPGAYAVPGERKLTLTQLIISAGGFGPTAIPERVDITRRLGPGQEATMRLNVRAIFEGNQPNIYVKADDTINVGTNIIAPFLAVTRNAFRLSYGFGFLLDRNFGTDVFGPIQTTNGSGGGFGGF